jgi:hypothetical protein
MKLNNGTFSIGTYLQGLWTATDSTFLMFIIQLFRELNRSNTGRNSTNPHTFLVPRATILLMDDSALTILQDITATSQYLIIRATSGIPFWQAGGAHFRVIATSKLCCSAIHSIDSIVKACYQHIILTNSSCGARITGFLLRFHAGIPMAGVKTTALEHILLIAAAVKPIHISQNTLGICM